MTADTLSVFEQQIADARRDAAAIVADAQRQADQILTDAQARAAVVVAEGRAALVIGVGLTVVGLDGKTRTFPGCVGMANLPGTVLTVTRTADRSVRALYPVDQITVAYATDSASTDADLADSDLIAADSA